MSLITESLEKIFRWLEHNQPSFASALQPGLTNLDIEEKTKDSNFYLPSEIYELYRWRNGVDYGEEGFARFTPNCIFSSLEYALDQYNELIETFGESEDYPNNFSIWNSNWFPIFSLEQEYLFVVCSSERRETSPIYHLLIESGNAWLKYTSLSSMLLTISECYESNVYYINNDGDFEVDEQREETIRAKYNPDAKFLRY